MSVYVLPLAEALSCKCSKLLRALTHIRFRGLGYVLGIILMKHEYSESEKCLRTLFEIRAVP
jgi:hypothetical protein